MTQSSRIFKRSKQMINEMAGLTGKEEALEIFRHYERLRIFNEAYEKLRNDEKSWQKEIKERKELEGTLNDS